MPGTAHRYSSPYNVQVGDRGLVVTVPKHNKAMLEAKIDSIRDSFWVFQRTPQILDRDHYNGEAIMYVVYDGNIDYAFVLGRLEYGPREALDPEWYEGHNPEVSKTGCRVWLEDVLKVKPPIKMKGFQGFRYLEPSLDKHRKRIK